MVLVALYVGEVSYDKILEMTYPFYKGLMKEISLMLNYNAVVNLYGNAYAGKEAFEQISSSNPMNYREQKLHRLTMEGIANTPLMKGR